MLVDTAIKGVAAGLLIAAPVGPVGVLCVHRTLTYGRIHGLLSGLGAAAADSVFACIVAFGLRFVSEFLLAHQFTIRLAGGGFLILLGIKSFFAHPRTPGAANTNSSLIGDCVSTFMLTITNPITIISFFGVFAALGVSAEGHLMEAGTLVGGVFAGSALWWLLLAGGVGMMRHTMEEIYLRWSHVIAGVLLLAFGVGVLALALI